MTALLALLLSLPASAGSACPIGISFYNYTPHWRVAADDLAKLESKRSWIGMSYGRRGGELAVTAVLPGSPAAKAGLQVGEKITEINGQAVAEVEDANRVFDSPGASKQVVLKLEQDNGVARMLPIAYGQADPVLMGMVSAVGKTDCRQTNVMELSATQTAAVEKHAFNEQRGFQCDSAHKGLAESFDSGSFVMVRGGSRILMTMPGWKTLCVGVDEYDGEGASAERLTAVAEKVAEPYVHDRHENP